MFNPRYKVTKAEGVSGDPIPEDEPVIVIRAQDVLSHEMMQFYITRYANTPGNSREVLRDLYDHASALMAWQQANPDKMKVADR